MTFRGHGLVRDTVAGEGHGEEGHMHGTRGPRPVCALLSCCRLRRRVALVHVLSGMSHLE